MKTNTQTKETTLTHNACVRQAYNEILKQAKLLLSTIERHELRCTLQRSNNFKPGLSTKVHELVNPLIYLSLEYSELHKLSIHYGFEQFNDECEYSAIVTKFLRTIYKLTSVEYTEVDIEECLNSNYVITNCSELYEVIEDNNKHHTFKLIPYKATPAKRKLKRVA